MSKSSVPDVYAKVIHGVCEASQQDFEEGGVDLAVLELLKQGWQKRLTAEHIADFPWDPKTESVQKAESTPLVNSAKHVPTLPSNSAALTPPSSGSTPGPQIKQENGQYVPRLPPQANYGAQTYPNGQSMTAEQRAAMQLQERFGDQAKSQVAQLQGQQQRLPSQTPNQTQPPYIKQEFKQEDNTAGYPQPTFSTPATIKTSQVDGAADVWDYEVESSRRKALYAQHGRDADRLIRSRVLAEQRSREGGGLMLPLDQHIAIKEQHERKQQTGVSLSLTRAQGDATGDDEDDEDAINSDLDDPDELDDGNGEDENVPNVMLCTYDKVQRVKNKWKCTLKDGLLKVDGSEFVFHKGQGEFEW